MDSFLRNPFNPNTLALSFVSYASCRESFLWLEKNNYQDDLNNKEELPEVIQAKPREVRLVEI